MKRPPWWAATAISLALLAASLSLAMRAMAGPPGAIVHVRWQPSIGPADRETLEARFRLTGGEPLDGDTWRYDLVDPSTGNLRALVTDPAVEDTHDIDRRNYSLAASAIRTPRQLRGFASGDMAVQAVDVLSLVLAALAGLLVALGVSGQAATPPAAGEYLTRTGRRMTDAVGPVCMPAARWLSRGIPTIDAQAAGAFRIVFGLAVLAFFASHPEGASSLTATFNPLVEGALHASVLQWLRAHPSSVDFLMPWLLTMGVAFTAGIFTRLTYVLFVAGVLVWLFLAVVHDSTHPHSALALALVALLPSRWGDALSVDSLLRRRRRGQYPTTLAVTGHGDTETRRHQVKKNLRASVPPWPVTSNETKVYGYSVWVPGFVIGVAFAAAAWAKLAGTGPDWVLNGSVKYHFLTDSFNAPVDWGLQLAGHPRLAVLASLAAVSAEALVVTAAFTRSEWYRVSMGVVALGLLAGFWLFMGVFWAGWWILLLGFVPWRRLGRLKPAPTYDTVRLKPDITYDVDDTGRLKPAPTYGTTYDTFGYVEAGFSRPDKHGASAAQLALIAFVIAQQVVVSAIRVERAPMFTYYPMYSSTYASPAQYDASIAPYYRIVVSTDRGRVELSCNAPEDLVNDLRAALGGSADSAARVWDAVRGCPSDRGDARDVTFEGDVRVFDWDRLAFTSKRAAVVLGPLAKSSG